MKTGIYFAVVVLCVMVMQCQTYGPSSSGQVYSSFWEVKQQIGSVNAWVPIMPPLTVRTADTSALIVLFNTECMGAAKPIPGADTLLTDLWAIPIQVRIRINDTAASPQESTLTNTPFSEMKSFVATLRDLPPGEYKITPEVKSASEKGWIGNRTLTVLESVRGERQD